MYSNFLCLRVFFYYIQKIKINNKLARVVLPNNEDQQRITFSKSLNIPSTDQHRFGIV